MNIYRMIEVAEYAKKNGITKTAKDLLTFEGNKRVDYSFKENLQICRRAVMTAVRWVKADQKRKLIKLQNAVSS